MERRYQARLDELLDDAQVRPGLLRGLLGRLETFLEPFVRSLCCCEQRTNARHYVSGLLSEEREAVSTAFDGMALISTLEEEGWICLTLRPHREKSLTINPIAQNQV